MDDFNMCKLTGISYKLRILFVTKIFDKYEKSGLSNREIHRRYIYLQSPTASATLQNIFEKAQFRRIKL